MKQIANKITKANLPLLVFLVVCLMLGSIYLAANGLPEEIDSGINVVHPDFSTSIDMIETNNWNNINNWATNPANQTTTDPTTRDAEWAFLVYLDGDNNLESAGIDDFLEMASVGSNADVKILVLFDRHPCDESCPQPGYSSQYGNWTDTRRGVINNGDVPDTSWGTNIGEVNMGNPQTLIDFVKWGMENYSASRYAVVLWDHGSGWRGTQPEEDLPFKAICWDDTSGDRLTMSEVRDALQTIETDIQEPDLVGFDACLMGMIEVAYEIRNHSGVMVGSEKTEPNDGWPYFPILTHLVADPTMSANNLGATIVIHYYASYSNGESEVLSAVSLSDYLINQLTAQVDSLTHALRNHWNTAPGTCAAAAYPVMVAIDSVIIYELHGSSDPDSHGLAIYFPENSGDFNADYNNAIILFPGATEWEEFLQDFYLTMAGSWVADARDASQEYDTSPPNYQFHHIDLYDFCLKIINEAPDTIWVDFLYSGILETGNFYFPYNTLIEAVTAASGGETICIKPGSSSETITINKQVILAASGGTVTIGSS